MKKQNDLKKNLKQATEELLHIPFGKFQEAGRLNDRLARNVESEGVVIATSDVPSLVAVKKSSPHAKTIIGTDTYINGNIRCNENIEIFGMLTGDIIGSSTIALEGKIIGKVECTQIDVRGGTVKGDINASGSISVDADSIIMGNINANKLCLNGKVKGDLFVNDALILQSKAVVLGKITVGSISVQDGAVFSGEVQMHSSEFTEAFSDSELESKS